MDTKRNEKRRAFLAAWPRMQAQLECAQVAGEGRRAAARAGT